MKRNNDLLTLKECEYQYGIPTATLRSAIRLHQMSEGRNGLRATKRGRDWYVTVAAIEGYLKRVGRLVSVTP